MVLMAMKAHYERAGKCYRVEFRQGQGVDPTMVHDGWVVFDNIYYAIGAIICGKLIPDWNDKKRDAILHALTCEGGK